MWTLFSQILELSVWYTQKTRNFLDLRERISKFDARNAKYLRHENNNNKAKNHCLVWRIQSEIINLVNNKMKENYHR